MPNQDTLEVYATRDGFYDSYRKHGDKFVIRDPDKAFSKRWMVPVDTKEGRAFIERHKRQENAAQDAITGERLQSGGEAEQIKIMMDQINELKTQLAEQPGVKEPETGKTTKPRKSRAAEPVPENTDEGPDDETAASNDAPAEPDVDEQVEVNAPAKAPRRRRSSN